MKKRYARKLRVGVEWSRKGCDCDGIQVFVRQNYCLSLSLLLFLIDIDNMPRCSPGLHLPRGGHLGALKSGLRDCTCQLSAAPVRVEPRGRRPVETEMSANALRFTVTVALPGTRSVVLDFFIVWL